MLTKKQRRICSSQSRIIYQRLIFSDIFRSFSRVSLNYATNRFVRPVRLYPFRFLNRITRTCKWSAMTERAYRRIENNFRRKANYERLIVRDAPCAKQTTLQFVLAVHAISINFSPAYFVTSLLFFSSRRWPNQEKAKSFEYFFPASLIPVFPPFRANTSPFARTG